MKTTEIRNLSDRELSDKLDSSIEEMFNLKFSATLKGLENPGRYRELRKTIAKIKTIVAERKSTGENNV